MVTYKQIKTCNQRDRHGANPQGYEQPLTTKIRVSEYSQEAENDDNGAILPVVLRHENHSVVDASARIIAK